MQGMKSNKAGRDRDLQQRSRGLLIDATITAIAEYGLSKLTLAKISSIAGLTAGTVNFHFDSKEALLLETLNFVSEEFDQTIADALKKSGPDPAGRLAGIINASLDPEITEHRKVAVWHAFDSESHTRKDYQLICGARDRKNFKLILNLCEQIIDAGGKRADIDARAVANAISGLTDELWKEILFEGESYDREVAKRVCMSFLASIFPWSFSMPPEAADSDGNADSFTIIQAGEEDLDEAAGLFDLYRQFYEETADLKLAKRFLKERMKSGDSVIYLALDRNRQVVGFMQLYPLFCSVAATPIWVLYDLYVDASVRRRGVGKQLMMQARELAKRTGASRIDLETAVDNINAQTLYESLGYERDREFFRYSLYIESD